MMRISTYAAFFILFLISAVAFTFVENSRRVNNSAVNRDLNAKWVTVLELTDLALFTEASYTRHLSQSDRHTPFRNHPMAFEHFPSGTLVKAPAHLKQ